MRIDLAKKAFKDLYVNKGLHGCNAHFDWFVKTYSNLLASDMGKEDPEAWREEYRAKQAAGVRFDYNDPVVGWLVGPWTFAGKKEDYREVPQEAPDVKETGVGIPEAARNILISWQSSGLKFFEAGEPVNFPLKFDCTRKDNYTIPEQPIPEGMSIETVKGMRRQGLRIEYNNHGTWEIKTSSNFLLPRINYRIPAQPIPEKLLEVPLEVSGTGYARAEPHAAERALWKAQREAGTNEVWQTFSMLSKTWCDLANEPKWYPDNIYRSKPKPTKLTAKITRWAYGAKVHDWEFYGTPEEYCAECEKYGYVVVSEIKEVKPKTVKYFMALLRYNRQGAISALKFDSADDVNNYAERHNCTIIGDIEEREVEV